MLERGEELEQADLTLRAAEARKKHIAAMEALAVRAGQAWQEVDHLLDHGRRIASVYDEATARLKKLEQLATFQGMELVFQRRVRGLAEKYINRQALIRRWKNQGWV